MPSKSTNKPTEHINPVETQSLATEMDKLWNEQTVPTSNAKLKTMEESMGKFFSVPEIVVAQGLPIKLPLRKKIDFIIKKHAMRVFLTHAIKQSPCITEDLKFSKTVIGEFIHRSRSMLNTMVNTVGSMNLKKRAESAGLAKKLMDYAESEESRKWFTLNGQREKLLVVELMYYIALNMFPLNEVQVEGSDIAPVTYEGLMKDIEIHNPNKLNEIISLWESEVVPLLKLEEAKAIQ